MSEHPHDQAPQPVAQAPGDRADAGAIKTMDFYRELRDVAIKSAHTGSPLSLLVFEPGTAPKADPEENHRTWIEDTQDYLQAGLRDCETLIACGANALFMILLGSELSEAERRVADLHQSIESSTYELADSRPTLTIGVAQRQDCEPLSHFVHRTRAALRSA